MIETPEARLKRMSMRSWRRGMKEMDLILGAFSDANLATMPTEKLDIYDSMMSENDQELYKWVTGQSAAPDHLTDIIDEIAIFAKIK